PDDAFHVAALRDAGAVILAKANLSEWANFRSTRSSSGWSGLGGQTKNPYVLDRNPCGSSSGSAVAVAAGLAPLAVGTETDGSIVCPAGVNGIVGIKPTVGLVSRDGIIPIAHTQDTAGPMARSVRDAVLLLEAMAAPDPSDPAASDHPERVEYRAVLDADALEGATAGIWRGYTGAGRDPRVEALLDEVVSVLDGLGATLVDPFDFEVPEGADDGEWEVLKYEFKADLERYLADSGVDPSVDTLAELVEFNRAHAETSMPWFGQEIFEMSAAKGSLTEPEYLEALEASHHAMRRTFDAALRASGVDVVVAPTNGPAWTTDWVNGDSFSVGSSMPAAVAGYPAITLPMGRIHGLPIGVSLVGRPWSEARLAAYAYALEQTLSAWRRPAFRDTPVPN
ncbi:MAG: amidase, partial [Thermoanaerobaculia bacterium]|nr:amidase [Thermoanaerobaculia bacterium]